MRLTDDQITTFLNDGILVVENVLTDSELRSCINGLQETLSSYGVETTTLNETGHNLRALSSTGGSGGVLDIAYYDDWKIRHISTNSSLFEITKQLWKATYCNSNNGNTTDGSIQGTDGNPPMEETWKHPYGDFDCERGYLYIDRIGYRLPTELAEKLGDDEVLTTNTAGNNNDNNKHKQKKKSRAIQRSLTPHLDCCPETFFSSEGKNKWRPIQCLISLVDTTEPNHGGFEAAKGFHIYFEQWTKSRPPTVTIKKGPSNQQEVSLTPAPCIGEYTHIRPKEDAVVMNSIQHIPVKAGGAIFWDNRIPHANAYRHDGDTPRAVVYSSFLPDVAINRAYVTEQLSKWRRRQPATDQWINLTSDQKSRSDDIIGDEQIHEKLSPLGQRLVGLTPWESSDAVT